jgi:hypothetical protein
VTAEAQEFERLMQVYMQGGWMLFADQEYRTKLEEVHSMMLLNRMMADYLSCELGEE